MKTLNRLQGLALAVGVALGGQLVAAKAQAVTKVGCVGASTTSGDGSTAGHHFPDELGRALGAAFQVKNFGVSGTTVLRKGDDPYWPHLPAAVAYQPDIAVFWFGGNDAKPQNWTTHKDEFIGDYEDMLNMFQALPTHPRLFVFKSMVIHDVEGIPRTVLEMEVLPKIEQIAADTHSIVINYHDAFITHPEYFPDGVHPNNAGTVAIGKFVADIIIAALSAAPDAGASDGAVATDASDAAGLPGADGGSDGSSLEAPAPASGSGGAGTGGSGGGASGTGGAPSSGNSGTGGTSGATAASSGSSGCALAAGSALPPACWLLALSMIFVAAARRRQRSLTAPGQRPTRPARRAGRWDSRCPESRIPACSSRRRSRCRW